MVIRYAGVSTKDQKLERQRGRLRADPRGTGIRPRRYKRPALKAALPFLRPEDQLVVWKVDKPNHSLREMLDAALRLQGQVVRLRSLTQAIYNETPTGRGKFNF